jgi:tryptophanyl-tRNA synthetase
MSTNGQRIRQTDPGDPDLCPVGDLHKVFSPPDMLAATQSGCRAATLRCEFCNFDAAKSVCDITDPIHSKRMHLESHIEQTWEMLRDQSARAAARAEQTMQSVRNIFDLSHDLGALMRHFLTTEEDRLQNHDLSSHSDWWQLPSNQRGKLLRDYWRNNLVPLEIPLVQESNRIFTSLERELEEPFLSAKKKRLFVTSSQDVGTSDEWHFLIPSKSYEVWALLCWRMKDYWLDDFVVPQKFYSQAFALAKKSAKKDERIPVKIMRDQGNRFFLSVAGSNFTAITDLRGNYEPLK